MSGTSNYQIDYPVNMHLVTRSATKLAQIVRKFPLVTDVDIIDGADNRKLNLHLTISADSSIQDIFSLGASIGVIETELIVNKY